MRTNVPLVHGTATVTLRERARPAYVTPAAAASADRPDARALSRVAVARALAA